MVGVFKKEKPLLFLQGGVSTLFLHPSLCCFMYVDEKLVAIYIKSKKKKSWCVEFEYLSDNHKNHHQHTAKTAST